MNSDSVLVEALLTRLFEIRQASLFTIISTKVSYSLLYWAYLMLHKLVRGMTMRGAPVCQSEYPEISKGLAGSSQLDNVLKTVAHGRSCLVDLRMKGFGNCHILKGMDLGLLRVENDFWIEKCAAKGDCLFLFLTAKMALTTKGFEVLNRRRNNCYCIINKR